MLVHEHALDGEHRVRAADHGGHHASGGVLEQRHGQLDRLARLALAEGLLGDELGHQQRELARPGGARSADRRDQGGRRGRAVGDDQDASGVGIGSDPPAWRGQDNGVIFGCMDDAKIEARIDALEQEEQRLRKDEEASAEAGRTDSVGQDAGRLAAIKVELDQLWDLLRQRRALRNAGRNPDDARMRDADTVERYLG